MSFSKQLKGSVSRYIPAKNCCRLAELSAIVRLTGSIDWEGDSPAALTLRSPGGAPVRKAHDLFTRLFDVHPDLQITSDRSLGRTHRYTLRVSGSAPITQILNELGVIDERLDPMKGLPSRIVRNKCCPTSYIRGAFLASGSITDPHHSYHLEVVSSDPEWARSFAALLERNDIRAKLATRKQSQVVYLKGSGDISSFLALIGGHTPLLEMEDLLVRRNVSNEINRLVNCDAANAGRTAAAAQKQLEDIRLISQTKGLEKLPSALREVAEARKEHPEASILELAETFSPPLTKSAVAHRLRRLSSLANRLRHDSAKSG